MKSPVSILLVKKLRDAGLTQSQIGQRAGCSQQHVGRLLSGAKDFSHWEQEIIDAIKFFDGKTPQQEYDQHTARRNALKQEFEDELI